MKELVVLIVVLVGVVTTLLGVPFFPLEVSVWEALDALSNIIPPILGALIALIIWLHKRIERLEKSNSLHDASLYGNEDDAMQSGVIQEVMEVKEELNESDDEELSK